jgi:hypothetical protein
MANITGNTADIGLIDTDTLHINQSVTSLRWDANFKHPDAVLLNSGTTIKLLSKDSGEKAVLANSGYIIGTDVKSFLYKINQGNVIHVGLSENTRNLASLISGDDLISHKLTVTKSTVVELDLSLTELKITYNNRTTTIDITSYNGKTMYPWVSDDNSVGGFSVSIFKRARLSIYVNNENTVVFETYSSDGVDMPIKFDTGSASLEFTGGQLITDTIHNLIESNPGTPMVLRVSGGSDVTIDSTGGVTTPGGIVSATMTSQSLTAPASTPLVLTSNGADSSLLAVGGNAMVKADGAGLTITSTTGAVVFDSTATSTSFISDSIRSTLGNNLTLYEQTGGGGLIIANSTANAQFSSDLAVLGGLEVNTMSSQTSNNLNLTENGGLGLHITDATGVVTSDALITAPKLRSADTVDLQLHNWAGVGLDIKDSTGDAVFGSTLKINSTLYGNSNLVLHNNSTDEKGITIDAVTGDVNCDSDLIVSSDATISGTASIGPTPIDGGICFAVSDGTGSKAMLMPKTASHTAISPVQSGMIVFNTSDQTVKIYNGAVWQTLATV